jgi:hypothetical protein
MPAPQLQVPAVYACYDMGDASGGQSQLPAPLDCGVQHNMETVHIGLFGGDAVTADTPPPDGSPARQQAYSDCANAANGFLGGDWRTGRIGLDVVPVSPRQWTAGGRWYRCDLYEFKDLNNYEVADRTSSLKGALSGSRPLALGCFKSTTKGDSIDTMNGVDCGTSHNTEFVGVWDAPAGAYPDDETARAKADRSGCRSVIASFAGVPNDANMQYRVGQIYDGFGKAQWDLGNRGVRCYIWMNNKTYTRSFRGVGAGGLPIN